MSRNVKVVFYFIGFVFFLACESKEDPENYTFRGITQTTQTGEIISQDITDWRFDDEWGDREIALFPEGSNETCSLEYVDYLIAAYPNPCGSHFKLYLSKPDDTMFSFRLVDQEFTILMSRDSITSGSVAINVLDLEVSQGLIRLYYKVFGQDCELRGHGDIQLE